MYGGHFHDFCPQKWWKVVKITLFRWKSPIFMKMGEISENSTFHRQTALWAPTASKTPKKRQGLTVFARGAPPRALFHFFVIFTTFYDFSENH